jgi:phospholipid transport system substrate-binding protein
MIIFENILHRRQMMASVMGLGAMFMAPAFAQVHERPEALVERLATELILLLKSDPELRNGNIEKINQLVDEKLMPHVNFTRMTASSVGRFWRQANPEQRQRLQQEFKMLLIRTYSGALTHFNNQTLAMRPSRYRPEDKEVTIRSEVRGRGDPVQVDYRLESTPNGWKIYDLNVMGIWLVETYRTQFAQEINVRGIDGLIDTLAQRNASNTGSAAR